MLDLSDMYKEESHTGDHMEVDGGEMITGSGCGSLNPSANASDKEDDVSDLGVHINLSNLIQVPKPSNRFTVTIDCSLINTQTLVPSSISSTCISLCERTVSNSNSNPSNTIMTVAAATLAVTITTTVAVFATTAATITTTTTTADTILTTSSTITTTTTTTNPTPTTTAVPVATNSITCTCVHSVYPKFGLFQFTEPVRPMQVLPASTIVIKFLNQARAGRRPARAWFPNVDPVRTSVCMCVCVFVCVSAPEAINN